MRLYEKWSPEGISLLFRHSSRYEKPYPTDLSDAEWSYTEPHMPAPEGILMRWAREWAREGVAVDWQRLMPPKGFVVLPRRWVVERTIAWIEQNRRMSKDFERLCASGEAFVHAAMIRLMTRRLARF